MERYLIGQQTVFTPDTGELKDRMSGSRSEMEPMIADILTYFIQNQGFVLSRDTLKSRFWSTEVNQDEVLTKSISKLRKVLGDARLIKTINKKGYLWMDNTQIVEYEALTLSRINSKLLFSKYTVMALGIILMIMLVIKGMIFPHH